MASPSVHPVAAFRESASAFQAALTACVQEPKVKSVHQLRTGTRRLEALLDILLTLKGLPRHKRAAATLKRRIKKLRRRAGALRDVDVSRKLLERHLPPDAIYSGQINQANVQLTRELEHRRVRLAGRLSTFLQKKQKKIAAALELLLEKLEGADEYALPLNDLLHFVEARFQSEHAVSMRDPSAEQMHSIRKAAKAARYATEFGADPAADAARQRFEALQEAGGQWHDWHMLSSFATRQLGEDHPISGVFAHLSEREMQAFRGALDRDRSRAAR